MEGSSGRIVCVQVSIHVTFFFLPPYFDMVGDETSTHSCGKDLILEIRGFIGTIGKVETGIGEINGGSS